MFVAEETTMTDTYLPLSARAQAVCELLAGVEGFDLDDRLRICHVIDRDELVHHRTHLLNVHDDSITNEEKNRLLGAIMACISDNPSATESRLSMAQSLLRPLERRDDDLGPWPLLHMHARNLFMLLWLSRHDNHKHELRNRMQRDPHRQFFAVPDAHSFGHHLAGLRGHYRFPDLRRFPEELIPRAWKEKIDQNFPKLESQRPISSFDANTLRTALRLERE